jgi:hypothetical protein
MEISFRAVKSHTSANTPVVKSDLLTDPTWFSTTACTVESNLLPAISALKDFLRNII